MLSRRQFLQAAGIAVAAHALPRLTTAPPAFETIYGRALEALPIYSVPDAAAMPVTRLWSDAVTPILESSGGWYRLPQGYAPREGMQPMITPAQHAEMPSAPPFWAEVTGALAVVRNCCAADAPLRARIGHGGVLRVIDYLPGDGVNWYGVAEAEDGDLLGWTQTAAWSPAQIDDAMPALTLAISVEAQRLTVRDGDHALLTAPISTDGDLPYGVYPVTERHATDIHITEPFGAPWRLSFGDDGDSRRLYLSGVYWHNRFGTATPGAAIQVTPPLAKWLYPRAREVILS